MTETEIILSRENSELRTALAARDKEIAEMKNEIITVGAKLVPLIQAIGIDKMIKNAAGKNPGFFSIVKTIGFSVVENWEKLQLLVMRDQNFFAHIIEFFTIRYGADVKKKMHEDMAGLMHKRQQAALGNPAANPHLKALK